MILPGYHAIEASGEKLIKDCFEYNNEIYKDFLERFQKRYIANLVGTVAIADADKYINKFKEGSKIYPFVSFVARVERLKY
jgi:hypothetical protein